MIILNRNIMFCMKYFQKHNEYYNDVINIRSANDPITRNIYKKNLLFYTYGCVDEDSGVTTYIVLFLPMFNLY